MRKRFSVLPVAMLGLCLSGAAAAHATVYQNSYDNGDISEFGSPDTTNYGQVFIAPGGALQSWTFTLDGDGAGNLAFVVAAWNGTQAVGPALYQSGLTAYDGSLNTAITWSGLNLPLTLGASYIAYLTVAAAGNTVEGNYITNAIPEDVVAGSATDGGLGGGFRFLNSTGVDPLTLTGAWDSWFIPNMFFSATFEAASVPEPATLALFGGALAGLGFMRRRKRRGA